MMDPQYDGLVGSWEALAAARQAGDECTGEQCTGLHVQYDAPEGGDHCGRLDCLNYIGGCPVHGGYDLDGDDTPYVVTVPLPLWQRVAVRLWRAAVSTCAVVGVLWMAGVLK
jgi:hypothetical protein